MLTWADGAALLAVFLWGANFPIMKLLMTVVDPLPLMFVRAALSSAVLGAFLVGSGGSVLWYATVRRLGAARTAIYANLESFFAVLAAALMLGERVEPTAVMGGVAVVAGVLLTRRRG